MSILVLQSSWCGRESWLLCFICLPGVSWWLSGSSSRCHGVVCGLWLWYFLIILTYYFWTFLTLIISAKNTTNWLYFHLIRVYILVNILRFSTAWAQISPTYCLTMGGFEISTNHLGPNKHGLVTYIQEIRCRGSTVSELSKLTYQAIGGCTYATVFSSKKWQTLEDAPHQRETFAR